MRIRIRGCDETLLSVTEYEKTNARGLVICVHGMAEHQKRYDDFAKYLYERGFAVVTYDHRGHGESLIEGEELGYLGENGFDGMVRDLDIIVQHFRKKYISSRCILMGHSMGSFVVQRFIQLYDRVDGVILMGSGYKSRGTNAARLLASLHRKLKGPKAKGKLFANLLNKSYCAPFKPCRTPVDWLNRLDREIDIYREDPYCGFVLSNQFYYDFFSGLNELQKQTNMAKIPLNLPILLISGLMDPVGELGKKVNQLFGLYRQYTKQIDLKLYKGARHELLHEQNKVEVYEDLYAWIVKYL